MAGHQHGIDPEPGGEDDTSFGAEPSIEGLMRQLQASLGGDEGWAGIDTSPEAMKRQRSEQAAALKKQANDFRDCFMTPAGRLVLEHMLDRTLRARPYPPELNLPLDALTPLIIAHDAQCNFVWAIVEAIALAENRKVDPRSAT